MQNIFQNIQATLPELVYGNTGMSDYWLQNPVLVSIEYINVDKGKKRIKYNN